MLLMVERVKMDETNARNVLALSDWLQTVREQSFGRLTPGAAISRLRSVPSLERAELAISSVF